VAAIQQTFGKQFPITTLFHTPTLADLASLIEQEQKPAPAASSALIAMQPEGENLPFFCVHALDGGVYYYAELVQRLGHDQPFYGLQAYGLEPGTTALHNVEEMAGRYIEAIKAQFPQGPYCIGGYSSGGIQAYEMVRQLWQAGEQVALLVLFDMPPSYDFFEDSKHFLSLMKLMGEYLGADMIQLYAYSRGIQVTPDYAEVLADLALFTSRQRLEILGKCIQETGVLPSDFAAERMERTINVVTTNSEAIQNYEIKPCPEASGGQVVLFRSSDDLCHRIPVSDYGWSRYIPLPITTYDIPGTHFTVVREPNVGLLAGHLKKCLGTMRDT
jgi:thioesterase domain-containing protein